MENVEIYVNCPKSIASFGQFCYIVTIYHHEVVWFLRAFLGEAAVQILNIRIHSVVPGNAYAV
jgi:hypothetical protein